MNRMTSNGPIYRAIKEKVTAALQPSYFEINDDSSKHAGHAAMKGLAPVESHFRLLIVSNQFAGMPLLKRHRAINTLLKEEMEKGVHALQINAMTPEEQEVKNAK